jgi:hypothetical protein
MGKIEVGIPVRRIIVYYSHIGVLGGCAVRLEDELMCGGLGRRLADTGYEGSNDKAQ